MMTPIQITLNQNETGTVGIAVMPVDFVSLVEVLGPMADNIRIGKVSASLFPAQKDPIHLTEDWFFDNMGRVDSLKAIVDFFQQQSSEYVIYKMEFFWKDLRILFDDDALLTILVPEGVSVIQIIHRMLNSIALS